MRLIYINVGMFALIKVITLFLILFKINTALVTTYLELPSNLTTLIYQPWSVVTYMFLHTDVMHIFFNMISLYWFGRIALERISQKQLVALYILGVQKKMQICKLSHIFRHKKAATTIL